MDTTEFSFWMGLVPQGGKQKILQLQNNKHVLFSNSAMNEIEIKKMLQKVNTLLLLYDSNTLASPQK